MFNRQKNVLAIDIGEYSVKAVELTLAEGRPRLLKAGEKALPTDTYRDRENRELIKQNCSAALSALMIDMKVAPAQSRYVISSIPGDKVNLKQIKSLSLSDDELRSSLAFEARKHVPLDGEWLMDFQVLAREAEDLQALLAVASKEAVRDHLDSITRSGFLSPVIDAPPLAIANAFLLNPAIRQEAETVLHLHIGASQTTVCLVRKNGLFFARVIPVAGNRFSEDLAKHYKIGFAEAERLKLEKGIESEGGPETAENGALKLDLVSTTEAGQAGTDELMREIQRSVRFYAKETANAAVDLAVLSGGSVQDPAFCKRVSAGLRCPVIIPDPFAGVGLAEGIPDNRRSQYFQVMGLALRGLHDVFPDQFKQA
jgi:type IV pilus assembly protein PilM